MSAGTDGGVVSLSELDRSKVWSPDTSVGCHEFVVEWASCPSATRWHAASPPMEWRGGFSIGMVKASGHPQLL